MPSVIEKETPEGPMLFYGDSLHSHNMNRPVLLRRSILNHPVFRRYNLLPLDFAICSKDVVASAYDSFPEGFSKGKFSLEKVFCDLDANQYLHLPVVLTQRLFGNPDDF